MITPRSAMLPALLLTLPMAVVAQPVETSLASSIADYTQRYGPFDAKREIVDDRGHGPAGLDGTRNLRAVLPGILYRSGTDNAHRVKTSQEKIWAKGPLPGSALTHLCQEGFSRVGFLYASSKFHENPPPCLHAGKPNTLEYVGTPYLNNRARDTTLQIIHDHIEGNDHRPVLVHCFNGWHASGWLSAIALRQFCGISGHTAWQYWKDTAAPGAGRDSEKAICTSLHNFKTDPTLKISAANRQLLCAGYNLDQTEVQDDCSIPAFAERHVHAGAKSHT